MVDFHNNQVARNIEEKGFALIDNAVPLDVTRQLLEATQNALELRRGEMHAMRHLLERVPAVREWCNNAATRGFIEPLLGKCFPVRGILFDKTPEANWKVVWHQDLTIAVREKRDVPDFGPWSEKEGVVHVQPPVRVLERMVTMRLHLDACHEANGPLRVLPGSHCKGRLDAAAIVEWRTRGVEESCLLPSGGVLLMKPLLLHASSPAQTPQHRRVIHIEWACEELPDSLQWHSRYGA
jgi:hypothetical protein